MSASPAAELRVLEDPRPSDVGPTPEAFLRALAGPSLLRLRGRDRSRRRAVATLIHGNEPSGIRALHGWLRAGGEPAVDVVALVASVPAALEPPGFAHRNLPDGRDLNRCFRLPFEGLEGAVARAALEALQAARPEALIDLHNNTGDSPSYGVALAAGPAERRLTAFFGDHLVHTQLRLGALVEATATWAPSVTIECGRAGDPAADAVALRGLSRYLGEPELQLDVAPDDVIVLVDPVRVCALPGTVLAFARRRVPAADLTVREDADHHNFRVLPAGEPIGWLRDPRLWPLEARDAGGGECSRELFAVRNGAVTARQPLIPIMMTADPKIAASDCLFYAVRPAEVPDAPAGSPPAAQEET